MCSIDGDKPRYYFAIKFKRQARRRQSFSAIQRIPRRRSLSGRGINCAARGSQPLRELARLCERPESTVPDGVLTATVNLPRNRAAVLSIEPVPFETAWFFVGLMH